MPCRSFGHMRSICLRHWHTIIHGLKENHALLTTPYLNSSIVVVRNSKPQSHERDIVALPNSFNLTNSILDNPEYDTEDVVYYDTIEECFQAVLSGSADCTYADNYSANYLLSPGKIP